jgi:hypothetical protein
MIDSVSLVVSDRQRGFYPEECGQRLLLADGLGISAERSLDQPASGLEAIEARSPPDEGARGSGTTSETKVPRASTTGLSPGLAGAAPAAERVALARFGIAKPRGLGATPAGPQAATDALGRAPTIDLTAFASWR